MKGIMSTDTYTMQKFSKSQTNWLILEQPILFSLRLAAFLSRRGKKNGHLRNQCQLGFCISSQQHGKFQRTLWLMIFCKAACLSWGNWKSCKRSFIWKTMADIPLENRWAHVCADRAGGKMLFKSCSKKQLRPRMLGKWLGFMVFGLITLALWLELPRL